MARRLIYYSAVSLILITPFVYSMDLYNGLVTAKQIWFYVAFALFLLVFSIDFMFWKRSISIAFNKADLALLIFYGYFFIRTATTPYMPMLHNQKFLNWTLLIIIYFVLRIVIRSFNSEKRDQISQSTIDEENNSDFAAYFEKNKITFFIILFLIVTGLVEAIWGLRQLYGFSRSFNSNFKITGSFFNPAPYALYLAAVFPLALGVLVSSKEMNDGESKKDLKRLSISHTFSYTIQSIQSISISYIFNKLVFYLSLFTVFAILVVLPATMIRASWLGVIAGSLVVLNYRYNLINRIKGYMYNPARRLIAPGIIILLIITSAAGLFYLKKGSSNGRLLIWEVTLGKIADKPLFGNGVGRFEAEYNNWQAEYFELHPEEIDGSKGMVAGNTSYAFNEYLELTSEAGVTGLLLFSIVVVITLVASFKKNILLALPPGLESLTNILPKESSPNGSYTTLTPSLISFLIVAIISFPFYSLPTLIVFFLLLALLSTQIEPILGFKVALRPYFIRNSGRFVTTMILLPLKVLLLMTAHNQYKNLTKYNDALMQYQNSSYSDACKMFSDIYDPLKYMGSYLQYYGKAISMDERYQRSLEILERSSRFGSDVVLYTNLGDCYKELKKYSEAEKAYMHASFMVPHKIYPLYLLANMYMEKGESENALRMAEKVLNKTIKIESSATNDIRQAMNELISNLNIERKNF